VCGHRAGMPGPAAGAAAAVRIRRMAQSGCGRNREQGKRQQSREQASEQHADILAPCENFVDVTGGRCKIGAMNTEMNTELMERRGQRLLVAVEDGPKIGRPQDARESTRRVWSGCRWHGLIRSFSVADREGRRVYPRDGELRVPAGDYGRSFAADCSERCAEGPCSGSAIGDRRFFRGMLRSWRGNWWLPTNGRDRRLDFLHFVG
jgi:hypothetical protein